MIIHHDFRLTFYLHLCKNPPKRAIEIINSPKNYFESRQIQNWKWNWISNREKTISVFHICTAQPQSADLFFNSLSLNEIKINLNWNYLFIFVGRQLYNISQNRLESSKDRKINNEVTHESWPNSKYFPISENSKIDFIYQNGEGLFRIQG